MSFRQIIYHLLLVGLVVCWAACNNDQKVVHQPLDIDFKINGNSDLLATNTYAGTPSVEDIEKVLLITQGIPIQLEAVIKPKERVKETRWYLGENNFSKELQTEHTFQEEGLQEVQFCINEGYRCLSKYVFVQGENDAPTPTPTPIDIDTDGDGILDKNDDCPNEVGIASKNGCPDTLKKIIPPPPPSKDTDGDGLLDNEDECPYKYGPKSNKGCPDNGGSDPIIPPPPKDSDNDGVKDSDDDCPNLKGLAAFNGCPDDDGDGIPSPKDKCPNVKGIQPDGCPPVKDADKDGIIDSEDDCPTKKGPRSNKGCPIPVPPPPPRDTDRDGIPDKDDKCPKEKGEAAYDGCPPPAPCDIARSGTIGILTADRCDQKTFVDAGKITIKPKRCIELEGGVLYTNDEGKVKIYITGTQGHKSEVLVKKVNSGRSQIAGLEELFISLKANQTYYLHIESQKNDKGRIPQLENISGCNPTVLPNDNLVIDYTGNYIIMDLKYAY